MLLPGCESAGARRFCTRLLEAFREVDFPMEAGEPLRVSVSMGVATHGDTTHFESCHQLMRSADQALYDAKQGGKNRFIVYSATASAA